jgi:hypothetical protein
MGQAKSRASEIAVLKAEQPEILRDALRMGEPHQCFYNSMKAVFACPERLQYVEGFVISEYECRSIHFIDHGWVVDKVTGQRHELTLGRNTADDKYVGKEFEKDDLTDPFEHPIESPEWWEPQLSLQQQYDMLKAAGYDIELWTRHWNDATKEVDEWGDVVDTTTIDLKARCVNYDLAEACGEGWEYEWCLKEAEALDATIVTNVTIVAEATMAPMAVN